MAMRRGKEGLTSLGDHDLAEQLAGIQAELQRRHPGVLDISLTGDFPQASSNPETFLIPLSAETQKLVDHMRKDGFAVYDSLGKTPASVRADGMPFWYLNPALENMSAAPALLAFKTKP